MAEEVVRLSALSEYYLHFSDFLDHFEKLVFAFPASCVFFCFLQKPQRASMERRRKSVSLVTLSLADRLGRSQIVRKPLPHPFQTLLEETRYLAGSQVRHNFLGTMMGRDQFDRVDESVQFLLVQAQRARRETVISSSAVYLDLSSVLAAA